MLLLRLVGTSRLVQNPGNQHHRNQHNRNWEQELSQPLPRPPHYYRPSLNQNCTSAAIAPHISPNQPNATDTSLPTPRADRTFVARARARRDLRNGCNWGNIC